MLSVLWTEGKRLDEAEEMEEEDLVELLISYDCVVVKWLAII